MSDAQVERSRQNEERFAEANARILEQAEDLSIQPVVPFLCECSAMNCTEVVTVALTDYRRVREQGAFLQVPGHDDAEVETVVEDCGSYAVVEKND